MKLPTIAYTITALTLTLAACQPKKQALYKTWFFAQNKTGEQTFHVGPALTPENFIDLHKDGSYTSYLSTFDYGTWEVTGRKIKFQNQKGNTSTYKIVANKEDQLILNLAPDSDNGGKYIFTGISNDKTTPKNNPFSKENNTWRIPPSRTETSEEIKDRLVAHFRFWELYFKWAVENELQTLTVNSENTPLQLYGNGFKLIPYDELPDPWHNNFYDEANRKEAWEKLKHMMETKDVNWPDTKNRFQFFISAFRQLQTMVD